MPASMMIALVASSPNVIGSRMLMPESGPIPGSTPTSVPTRQPRKAYQRISGRRATENPSRRLSMALCTRSESQDALFERRLQHDDEQKIGAGADTDAVDGRIEHVGPLEAEQAE